MKILHRIFTTLVLVGLVFSTVQPALASLPAAPAAPVQPADATGKIEPLLLKQFQTEGAQADFFVWLTAKADLSPAAPLKTKAEKGAFVFAALRATAESSQRDLRAALAAGGVSYRPYYIANKILVRSGPESLLFALAARPDVAKITANHTYQLEPPKVHAKAVEGPETVEGNIAFVNADDVWALGITGEGVVLAANDTGLDWQHPAIQPHYRGWDGANADHNYNWWDATGTYPNVPGDGFGHGTHVSGTMIGDDGEANQIGMAPGAKTVHCKNLDDGGGGDDATISECFEWDLAPWDLNHANPRPDLAPDAVNNSWGYWGGNLPIFTDEIAALQAAGILIEVSAGNEGPSCTTLRSPGDYGEVLTTGSAAWAGQAFPGALSYFSSRGPSLLSPDYLPDVTAPGENVRSALPGGGYEAWDGTSMAGPHVVGLVGLMWSANPALRGMIPETHQLIFETAAPLTGQNGSNCGGDYTTGPNNDWGYGTIDALAAVDAAMSFGGTGLLRGHVSDSATTGPLAGAAIRATLSPTLTWQTTTNAEGDYARLVFSGTYTVTASLYGYYPDIATGIQVISGTTTTHDIALDPAPFYTVTGQITDAATGWPLYAQVSAGGYPGDPVWTDPATGSYSISLAAGVAYTFRVDAWVSGYTAASRAVGPLPGPQTEDFALEADLYACTAPGYQPEFAYFENFEGGDGGFTVEGATSWEWGKPTSGPGRAHSGYYSWATNLTGNYSDNEYGTITSPDIDLSGYPDQTIIVSWWQWLQTESGFDYAWVEASNDGGASWVGLFGPLSGQIDSEWTKYTAYLDPSFAASNFRLRFTLQTDSSVTFPGFYVDDIGVGVAYSLPPLYAEAFDTDNGTYTTTGTTSWEWGVPSRGPSGPHSAPNVWATNLSGNYADNEDGYTTSPLIDLAGGADQFMLLSWWQWLQTESGYDFASVEVSANGGLTWTVVYTTSGIIDTDWSKTYVELDPSYATDEFQVRFRLQSDNTVTYPGFYIDDVRVDIFDPNPPTVPCGVPTGGLVIGNVYDVNTGAALAGATVSGAGISTLSQATPADPAVDDGFYALFMPVGTSPISATLAGYGMDTASPLVVTGAATVQDLYLPAGLLVAGPNTLEITLDMSTTASMQFVLTNTGGLAAAYDVRERAGGFLPAAYVSTMGAGRAAGGGNASSATAASGYVPGLHPSGDRINPGLPPTQGGDGLACVFKDIDPWGVTDVEAFLAANAIPYEVHGSGEFGTLDFSACQMIIFSGDQSQSFYDAYAAHVSTFEEYVEGGGFLNFFSADMGWNGGSLTAPLPGGMVWNPNYAEVNVIDDPAHPVVQGVPSPFSGFFASHGAFSNLPEDAHVIASEQGSGNPTIVEYPMGSGWLIAFGQPLEISHSFGWDAGLIMENTLLWGHEYLPSAVTWLTTTPLTGTLEAAASQAFTVTFDSGLPEVAQPGAYFAALRVKNDTPYGFTPVAVVMNVAPPEGWGRLAGAVTGLGACDAAGAALQGAAVTIEGVASFKSGETGGYVYWMPAGTYTVTVSASGFVSQTFAAAITAGQTTPGGVALRLDAPCASPSVSGFEVSALAGEMTEAQLQLDNLGAASLFFGTLESLYSLAPVSETQPLAPAAGFAAPGATGPASVFSTGSQGGAGNVTPLSGWFGGLELPGGVVRYAFAQCAEQPENFYVISGVDGSYSISNKAWRYDATTNDWTRLADVPSGAEAPSAACYQGSLYFMGGGGSNQFYTYAIASDTWAPGPALPRNVEGAAAAAWDGKIYLIGGDDDFFPGSGVSDEVDIYDLASETWSSGTPLLTATANAGFVQVGDSLYVVGGWGNLAPSQNVTATQRYDLEADSWELGPAFASARADFALAATNQGLYALGGDADGNGYFEGSPTAERLALAAWPAGSWADLGDQMPLNLAANNAGFCTQALFEGADAEIWSVGGLDADVFSIGGRALFHELAGETCFSIYSDVPWLSIDLASGAIPGDSGQAFMLTFDATGLEPGLHTATLVIITNDPQRSQMFFPVAFTVTPLYHTYLPAIVR